MVYPLYPWIKKYLGTLFALYAVAGLGSLAQLFLAVRWEFQFQAAAFLAASVMGLALTLHQYVKGAPPPEGMMAPKEAAPGEGGLTYMATSAAGKPLLRFFIPQSQLWLLYAAGPLVALVIAAICGVAIWLLWPGV